MEKKNAKAMVKRLRTSKQFKYGGFSTLLIVLVIAAVVLVNVGAVALTNALGLNLDLTRNSKYTLSAMSKQILGGLSRETKIYAMFTPSTLTAYPEIEKLFENISGESKDVSIEYLDLTKNPAVANRFVGDSVSAIQEGDIIVTRADESKFRVLTMYDLFSFTYDEYYQITGIEAFKGEEAVMNAIVFTNSDNSPRVFWLTDHQEVGPSYYSHIQSELQKHNYQCATLASTQLDTLERGDTLVVMAPQRDLSQQEFEQMRAFMADGGRMIYMSEISVELPLFDELLSLYGVRLENNLVLETSPNYYYMSYYNIAPTLLSHDITTKLRTEGLVVLAPYMRSITTLDVKTSGLTVSSLLDTSADAYAKVDLQSSVTDKEPGDMSGPFSVGVAVEMVNDYDDQSKNTRLVVYGGVDFALTQYYGNPDLVLQSVSWMQESEETITIVGKSRKGDTLSFTAQSQLTAIQAVVLYVIPGLVIVSGVIVFIRRRHL